jgi:hypothetical protein
MADNAVFAFVCDQLETRSGLDRLAARGTVRIALKQAGLDAASVTPHQMSVVVAKVLLGELTHRGVANAQSMCEALAQRTAQLASGEAGETPEAIFRRLGERA